MILLLENGAEGVEQDAPRAVDLYTRAINEGNHIGAMNNLALLLENGAEGVDPDPALSSELRARARSV